MSKRLTIIAVFMLLFTATNFAQETFTHPTAQVSVTLPAGWTYTNDASGIVATPPDEAMAVTFSVVANDDLYSALEEVNAMLSDKFYSVRFDDPVSGDVNGLPVIYVLGTADEFNAHVAVIDAPAGNTSLVVTYFATQEALDAYGAALQDILSSISAAE